MESISIIKGLLPAAFLSLEICILSLLLSVLVSFGAGVALYSKSRLARPIALTFVEIFRGTSLLVQLFWLYFAMPLLGLSLDPFITGVLALGLNTGAYGAEVVRGALQSVSPQQHEAAIALNFTKSQTMSKILLPQAVVEMIPPFTSLAVQNLKDTSLVSMIAISDLTFKAQEMRNLTQNSIGIYGSALIIYLAMSLLIVGAMRSLEEKIKASSGRAA